MSTQEDISKREFSKDTRLVADGALPLGGRSSRSAYACPYCTTETAFDTAVALKDHIYTQHLWNNYSGHARIPIPICMSIGGMETQEQVSSRIDEMVKRDFVCDLELDEGVLSDDYTRELADAGFELELNWAGIEELEDDYEVQLEFISEKNKSKFTKACFRRALEIMKKNKWPYIYISWDGSLKEHDSNLSYIGKSLTGELEVTGRYSGAGQSQTRQVRIKIR